MRKKTLQKTLQKAFPLLIAIFALLTTVRSQLVSDNAFLKGNFVEVGIGPCGTYGSSVDAPSGFHPRGNGFYTNRLGFIADASKDGWDVGTPNYCGDYFVPGTPEEGFGLQINGINYNNNLLCQESNISGSISDYKISGSNIIGTWSGSVAGIDITSITTVPINDVFFISEVTLKNTTGSTLNNIYYMRNVDPDNEVTLPGGSYVTNNFIVAENPNVGSKALVSATGLAYGCYLGLGTLDCRARVSYGGFSNRNPADVWNGTGGLSQSGSSTNDIAISIAFKINSLAPGETTTFRFAHVLSAEDLTRALNLTIPSIEVNGIPVDSDSSVNVCAGIPVPIQVINGSAYTFNWTPATGLNTTMGPTVIATISSPVTYTATGVDACGSSVSLSVSLKPTPSSSLGTIGEIAGPTSICFPAENQIYSVEPVTNALLYEWVVPSGVSIVGGDGTNSITVSFSSPVSDTIYVKARNGCGVTNTSRLFIDASTSNAPIVVFDDTSVVASSGSSGANVTYPDPIVLSSKPVSFSYSKSSGSFFPIGTTVVRVIASNSCGSTIDSFNVIVSGDSIIPVCPHDDTFMASSCDAKAVIKWTVPSNTYPDTIMIAGYPGPGKGILVYNGSFKGHGYYSSAKGTTLWSAGTDLAEFLTGKGIKGHLLTINSAEENNFILGKLSSKFNYSYQIGLFNYKTPGNFLWITGEPLNYKNWATGQPDNHGGTATNVKERYVVMRSDGTWNDTVALRFPFIAEFEKPLIVFRQISGPKNGSLQSVGNYTICYERTNLITMKKDTCCFNISVTCSMSLQNRRINPGITTTSPQGLKVTTYPNPSHDYFALNIAGGSKQKISISITDQLGRVVEARSGVAPNQNLKIGSSLKPGYYIIQVTQGASKVVSKLIKE